MLSTRDDFDAHLRIMIGAGERTRGILYLLGLVFAAILAVVGESDIFAWSEKRLDHMSKAFVCYTQHKSGLDQVPHSTISGDICANHYKYVEYYSLYLDPTPFPEKHDYSKTWDALLDRYKLLSKEYVEGADIPVPILGLKIDRGSVFFFSSIMLTLIFMTLRFSMINEAKCIHHAIQLKIIKTKSLAQAVINTHVFAKSRESSISFWWFLFVPSVLILFDSSHSVYDAICRFPALLNDYSLLKIFFLEVVCIAILIWTNVLCFKAASALDDQLIALSKVRDAAAN